MRWAAIVLFCSVLCAADPQLFFSKVFPGSVPDYVSITVEKSLTELLCPMI